MKIKKKPLLAIVILVMVAVIGFTIAYFTSSASFVNEFTTGTYKVTTTETFESPDNWKPGEEIPKTITTTNEGTIPAAVRVSYTEQWLDGDSDITSSIDEGTAIINLDNTNDWTKEGNYYYYNYILEPNETTSSFIKSVTLNPELGDDDDDTECTTSNNGLTVSCEATNSALGATYKLTITKETVQADKYKEVWNTNVDITEKSAITYISRQVEGQITAGDVIGIGETEDFYVISSDSEKTVLLAKYNLLVGNIVEDWDVVGQVQTSTQGYGLQSTDATCSYNTGFGSGSVAFSATNYWNNLDNGYAKDLNGNPADYEGNPYPYVYDSSYISMPDFNNDGFETSGYSVAYYVEQYKARLIEMGAPSTITGRLLSYEEAVASIQIEDNGNSIINSLYYWLGSVTSDNDFIFPWSTRPYNEEGYLGLGVRPVIEIPTSELQ